MQNDDIFIYEILYDVNVIKDIQKLGLPAYDNLIENISLVRYLH